MSSTATLNNILDLTAQLKEQIYNYSHEAKQEEKYIEYANDVQFDLTHMLENVELTDEEAIKCVNLLHEVRTKRRIACLGKKNNDNNKRKVEELGQFLRGLDFKIQTGYNHYQVRTQEVEDLIKGLPDLTERSEVKFRSMNGDEIKTTVTAPKSEPKSEPVTQSEPEPPTKPALTLTVDNSKLVDDLITSLPKAPAKVEEEYEDVTIKLKSGMALPNTAEQWKNYLALRNNNPNPELHADLPDGYILLANNQPKSHPALKLNDLTEEELQQVLTDMKEKYSRIFRVFKQGNMWIIKEGETIIKRSNKIDNIILSINELEGKVVVHEKNINVLVKHLINNYANENGKLVKLA